MISLHLKPLFCIGHGSLNTVFNLSTFSHEIGHTTTPREPDLEKLFLEYPNSVIGSFEVSNEDDSYLYNLILNKVYSPEYAKETCELGACGYDLVVNKSYSPEYAKATCELDACGYDLVVNKSYSPENAKATCKANP